MNAYPYVKNIEHEKVLKIADQVNAEAGQVVDTSESYQTTFETDEEYQEFLNMTQSTSLYNTGVEVTTADTIVTLSTCTSASDNHRFVVRGVKEEETKQ